MKRTISALLVALGCLLTACEETVTLSTSKLCTPVIQSAAPPDDSEEPATSTFGGELELSGRNFWTFFSGTQSSGDGRTDFGYPYDLRIFAGGGSAEVIDAWEETVDLSDEEQPLNLDGTVIASNCAACTTCVNTNAYGCGGCDAECLGCRQVVVVALPTLPPTAGQVDDEGATLTVAMTLVSGINQSPVFYYDLPISACADGLDNDTDGLIDADDPECSSSDGQEE